MALGLRLAGSADERLSVLMVKVAGGVRPMTVLVNGVSVVKSTAGASEWSIRRVRDSSG